MSIDSLRQIEARRRSRLLILVLAVVLLFGAVSVLYGRYQQNQVDGVIEYCVQRLGMVFAAQTADQRMALAHEVLSHMMPIIERGAYGTDSARALTASACAIAAPDEMAKYITTCRVDNVSTRILLLSGSVMMQTGQRVFGEGIVKYLLAERQDERRQIFGLAAQMARNVNDTEKFRSVCEDWMKAFPDDEHPHALMAAAPFDEEDWETAIKHLDEALKRTNGKTNENLSQALLVALIRSKNVDRARPALVELSKIEKAAHDLPLREAQVLQLEGKFAEALEKIEGVVKAEEKHPEHMLEPMLVKGQILTDSGEYQKALEVLERVISLSPTNAEAYRAGAKCLNGVGREADAKRAQIAYDVLTRSRAHIQQLQTQMQLNPNDPGPLYELTRIYASANLSQVANRFREETRKLEKQLKAKAEQEQKKNQTEQMGKQMGLPTKIP